jgi:uroporphyrinogen decarboxylase
MTSYQRVALSIAHKKPDRTPIFNSFVPVLRDKLRKHLNVPADKDLGLFLGNDIVVAGAGIEKSLFFSDQETYTCPWNITWRNVANPTGHHSEIIVHPLSMDEALADWSIPDPTDPGNYVEIQRLLDDYKGEYWIAGSCRCTLFETVWYLRGLERLLLDMFDHPEYVDALFDKVLPYPRHVLTEFARRGVDMVWLGDDVGSQRGMLISPAMWRRFIKPRYKSLIQDIRAVRSDIVVAYHSCGNCKAIIPELVEIGVDVLHPIQPKAMDPLDIKAEFGDRIVLFGALDLQELMPYGRAEDVRREVGRLIQGCGKGGGFILAGAHHLQGDTPVENVLAFYDAACGG